LQGVGRKSKIQLPGFMGAVPRMSAGATGMMKDKMKKRYPRPVGSAEDGPH